MIVNVGKFVAENKKLLFILLLAAVFILPGIAQVDLLGDNGHYFIRAVGYLDHLFSSMQTTPVDWYDNFPRWAFFSFHDHPFLLFFVQHIFILIYESLFFAKLPYVLFSLGAIAMLYLWMKEEYGEDMAQMSAILLAVNPLFVWTARTGFMEAGVIFFIVLSFYYFAKFCREEKYWFLFGLSLGLAFLSKYSTFFLFPTFLVYLLFFNRQKLKEEKTYYAFMIAFVTFLPSLIYNLFMYKTHGHFDYQFARLFNMPSPWTAPHAGSTLTNPFLIFSNLGATTTFVYLALAVFGLFWALKCKRLILPAIGIVFLTLLFVITGVGNQYLNLYNVMVTPFVAYVLIKIGEKFSLGRKILFYSLCAYLVFVVINSNMLVRPLRGLQGVVISSAQSKNYGFYQLDRYMEGLIKDYNIVNKADGYMHIKIKHPAWMKKYGVSTEDRLKGLENTRILIVYDQDINWFARLWALTRRQFYHNVPIVSIGELINVVDGVNDVQTLFYIKATENTLLDSVKAYSQAGQEFEKQIIDQGAVKLESVYRSDGKEAFQVFRLDNAVE